MVDVVFKAPGKYAGHAYEEQIEVSEKDVENKVVKSVTEQTAKNAAAVGKAEYFTAVVVKDKLTKKTRKSPAKKDKAAAEYK